VEALRKVDMYKRTVVVVEDEDLLRSLLSDSLESAGFSVASAANAADARRVIRQIDPDAVLLDIDLGRGPNGFELAEALRKESEGIGIVFLTSMPDPRFVGREQDSVPKNEAYLSKSLISESRLLVDALEAVLKESGIAPYRHHELGDRPFAKLSKTQIQVLQLLAEGKTNHQIADIRERSLGATESVISRTLEALGLDTDLDANTRVTAVRKYLTVIKPNDKNSAK
jgi:DNA-binding NarL/FixJ family response regulator